MSQRRPNGDPHRLWLELLDTDGPFLAVPALRQVWPSGMPAIRVDAYGALVDAKPTFEKAWENRDLDHGDAAALDDYRKARDAWVQVVLTDVYAWNGSYQDGSVVPDLPTVHSPDYTVTVKASGALVHDDLMGALVLVVDPVGSLRDPLTDGWSASPIDRMEELLRASRVPIGVVTDGRWRAVVSVPEKVMAASGIVDAQTWIEEPLVRNAFVERQRRSHVVERRSGRAQRPRCEDPARRTGRHRQVAHVPERMPRACEQLAPRPLTDTARRAGSG
jgi:hypothetical protein